MCRSLVTCIFALTSLLVLGQRKDLVEARKLADKGDYKNAIIILDKAISVTPNMAGAYVDKTNYLISSGQLDVALRTLNISIKLMPDTAVFYDMRGSLLDAGFDSHGPAIQDFTVGFEKSKDNKMRSRMLTGRAGTKVKIRDFNSAYEDMRKAVMLDSVNMDALNKMAVVCIELNKSTEALKYLNQVIKLNPTYAPAYVNIGFRYQGLGQQERAIGFFNKAAELDPHNPFAFSNRAFSKLKLSDLDGAMKDINESIRIQDTNSYAYKVKALIEIEKQMKREACDDLHKANAMGYTQRYGGEVNDLIGKHCK